MKIELDLPVPDGWLNFVKSQGLNNRAITGIRNATEAIRLKIKFTRLTVIDIVGYRKNKLWVLARCDCGVTKEYRFNGIKSGRPASCGCLRADRTREVVVKHGESKCPTRKTWLDMKKRCLNIKISDYSDYGGRGIKVCDEWMEYENFKRDMGVKPSNQHSIERIDVNGDYCPSNCIWELKSKQSRNTRRNVFIPFNGKQILQIDLARLLNVSQTTIRKYRVNGKLSELIESKSRNEWLDEGER